MCLFSVALIGCRMSLTDSFTRHFLINSKVKEDVEVVNVCDKNVPNEEEQMIYGLSVSGIALFRIVCISYKTGHSSFVECVPC